jgi:ribosomal protein L40E
MSKKRAKANRRRRQRTGDRDRASARGAAKAKLNLTCRECRAANDPDASECWLCHRRDWRGDPDSPAATTKSVAGAPSFDMGKAVGEALLILLALAVVEIGLLRLAPGLALAFLILLVPAWAITEWRARRRKEPMSAHHKFARIVVTTVLMPILLVLSLLIAVFAICMALVL